MGMRWTSRPLSSRETPSPDSSEVLVRGETGDTVVTAGLATGFREIESCGGAGGVDVWTVSTGGTYSGGWLVETNWFRRFFLRNHHARAPPRIATTGIATPTPIFHPLLSPSELEEPSLAGVPSELMYKVDVAWTITKGRHRKPLISNFDAGTVPGVESKVLSQGVAGTYPATSWLRCHFQLSE